MQAMKETAANIAASAKSGLEKTKATVQEKIERANAHNPTEKQMATERKEERIRIAELNKQEAREQNAAARQAAQIGGSYSYTASGVTDLQPTGGHQMSALPGHGTGQPAGQVTEGTIESYPVGTATGAERPTTAHDMHVGDGGNMGHGTGGSFSG